MLTTIKHIWSRVFWDSRLYLMAKLDWKPIQFSLVLTSYFPRISSFRRAEYRVPASSILKSYTWSYSYGKLWFILQTKVFHQYIPARAEDRFQAAYVTSGLYLSTVLQIGVIPETRDVANDLLSCIIEIVVQNWETQIKIYCYIACDWLFRITCPKYIQRIPQGNKWIVSLKKTK